MSGSTPGRRAAVALALLVVLAFAMRIASYRAGLPAIYHSDYVQVSEAAELVRVGSFTERASYPVTHVYFYAAADLVAYPGGRLLGTWTDWAAFTSDLEHDETSHAIARGYTAVVGALMVLAVYALARQFYDRRIALLAAAIVACSPVLVINAHQARIHVPGITLLVLAGIPIARLATLGSTTRRALAVGAGCGVVASVFQLGYMELLAAFGVIALRVRPLGAAARAAALAVVGFAAAEGVMWLLGHPPGVVRPREGSGSLDNISTLGLPRVTVNPTLEHYPGMLFRYLVAEPMVALGAILFAARALRARRFGELAGYGAYPALVFAALGSNYQEVRYSMSATPFLAVLAAAAFLEIRPPAPRRILAALAVAVPLAVSLRYDWILRQSDTRQLCLAALDRASRAGISASVEQALVAGPFALPRGIESFPVNSDFRPWTRGQSTPQQTLELLDVDLFLHGQLSRKPSQFGGIDPARAGFRRIGDISPGAVPASCVPDAPDFVIPDLFRIVRPGPPIAVWAKTASAEESARRCVLSFDR